MNNRKYCFTDLLKYTLEVLNLFGYNTSLLAICIGTIKNCGNYVQVKVKIPEFSPLLLLSLITAHSVRRTKSEVKSEGSHGRLGNSVSIGQFDKKNSLIFLTIF